MKSGFVALVGRSNVGKSTILNKIIGKKISIVTPKSQTTRNSIQGIYNSDDCQIIFVDTPGIHHSANKLDKFMSKNVRNAVATADVALYLFDGTKPLEDEER